MIMSQYKMTEKTDDSPKQIVFQCPPMLAAEVDLLLWDPTYEQVKYGARTALIVRLLREWVSETRKPHGQSRSDQAGDSVGC